MDREKKKQKKIKSRIILVMNVYLKELQRNVQKLLHQEWNRIQQKDRPKESFLQACLSSRVFLLKQARYLQIRAEGKIELTTNNATAS